MWLIVMYHAATSRWWYGRRFVDLMMWGDDVVDGIVLMCCHDGGMRWCVAVVVEVGVCAVLSPHGDV